MCHRNDINDGRGCATILKLSPNLRRIAKEPEPVKAAETGMPLPPKPSEKAAEGGPPKKLSPAEAEAAKMEAVLTDIAEHGIFRFD